MNDEGGVRRWISALAPMLLDMATPVVSFYLLHAIFGVSAVVSLTIGAVAAGLRTVYRAARDRRVNAFSAMMMLILVAAVVLVFITGDGRLILAKSALIPAVGGVYGIITTFAGRTLLYDVGQPFVTRGDKRLVAAWQACWLTDAAFARRLRALNLLWGVGFVVGAVLRVVVVYRAPLDVAVLAGQIPTVGVLLVLGVLTRLIGPPLARAMRAKAQDLGAAAGPDAAAAQVTDVAPGTVAA
jgi:hypothetical protein